MTDQRNGGPSAARAASVRGPILLLQGPVGPFFEHLASALRDRGHDVDRVRFNAGDRWFRVRAGRSAVRRDLNYREGRDAFGAWLRGLMWDRAYRAVVLFGAERPQHRVARAVAEEFGVPVIALEEGYVRGGFVAVERGGNNARSPLAGRLPPPGPEPAPPAPPVARTFRCMVWRGFLYYGRRNLWDDSRERELYHKEARRSVREVCCWARNLWRRARRAGDDPAALARRGFPYDIAILQVADDAQLGEAADGWSNGRLIAAAIESLARHAPADRHLVFKVHPLERGHTRDHRLIGALARRWKVADRVHCVLTGNLSDMLGHARGMITINSTSGFSALHAGKPLLVLGRAIYRHPALARCGAGEGSLHAFWTDPFVAPAPLREAFKRWLVAEALVPGDFYDPALAGTTAAAVAARVDALASEARPAARVVPFPGASRRSDAA